MSWQDNIKKLESWRKDNPTKDCPEDFDKELTEEAISAAIDFCNFCIRLDIPPVWVRPSLEGGIVFESPFSRDKDPAYYLTLDLDSKGNIDDVIVFKNHKIEDGMRDKGFAGLALWLTYIPLA